MCPAAPVISACPPRWHILCQVIDNFGDAGVLWRLAQQLGQEYGFEVHFFIDRLDILEHLAPTATRPTPQAPGAPTVHPLSDDTPLEQGADVIICGFQVRLPASARARLRLIRQTAASPLDVPLLIQLDYLSAEDWISGSHGLPSLQPDGLTEYFFYPGFTTASGGLLRERDLLKQRASFQADPNQRHQWLRAQGIPPADSDTPSLLACLLCYPEAPCTALLQTWLTLPSLPPLHLLIPGASTQPWTARLTALAQARPDRLRLSFLPFLPQAEFDHLLWSCDLNLVRGEDSWLRALWAGRPWLWQAYPQPEQAHLHKLDAFLNRAATWLPADTALLPWQQAMRAWNSAPGSSIQAIPAWLQDHANATQLAQHQADAAGQLSDLASQLVTFTRQARGVPGANQPENATDPL